MLEHFRCVPDIIQFSNHLSYDGEIKPLREQASSSLVPHVVPYRVEGGTRDSGKTNMVEATTIASLIVAACEHEAYRGSTFGVISLLGDDQAIEIERLLLLRLSPDDYEKRRIICGNAAQFQGDERDVMFLSMVQSPRGTPHDLLDRPEFRQRYNVAASRARDQMWVVYSLNHEVDLKPGDLRRRLIEHALNPGAMTGILQDLHSKADSEFERQVGAHLIRRGYRIRPQWPVGKYRIDLVVEGTTRRVAIECDGNRYHPIEKLAEDMERQAILERMGWTFVRIRGSVYFRNPDATIDQVVDRLRELEVEPRDLVVEGTPIAPPNMESASLFDEIVQRASELRAEWLRPDRGNLSEDATVEPVNESEFVPGSHPTDEMALDLDDARLLSKMTTDDQPSIASENDAVAANMPDAIDKAAAPVEVEEFRLLAVPKEITTGDGLADRILTLLGTRPGLKAREVARELAADRREVNALLYGRLGSKVFQDDEYRWTLRSHAKS